MDENIRRKNMFLTDKISVWAGILSHKICADFDKVPLIQVKNANFDQRVSVVIRPNCFKLC